MTKRSRTFKLSSLLILVTLIAVCLGLGRAFGFIAILLLVFAPVPVLGYLISVRSLMNASQAEIQNRWQIVNLLLAMGLLASIFCSMLFVGVAMTVMKVRYENQSRLQDDAP